MSNDEIRTTRGTTDLIVHQRGNRIALELPVYPMSDVGGLVQPIGRIELGRPMVGKVNYLGIEGETGALVRGYLMNSRHPDFPQLDEIARSAWLTVQPLPFITEVFIGTDKDL